MGVSGWAAGGAADVPGGDAVSELVWRRSSFCAETSCVEVAHLPDGSVMLRRTPVGSHNPIPLTRAEWDAFIAGVKAGEFDKETS